MNDNINASGPSFGCFCLILLGIAIVIGEALVRLGV